MTSVLKLTIPAILVAVLAAPATAKPTDPWWGPDLSDAPNLKVPAGHKLAYYTYAEGVQIYRWNGTSWAFVAPEAILYASPYFPLVVGTHYAGPTWESCFGSAVVGRVLERSTQDPDSIPWLLLEAASTSGRGVFSHVTYIQRVNTEGGLAPAAPGAFVGQEARVPYTADYFFYRGRR